MRSDARLEPVSWVCQYITFVVKEVLPYHIIPPSYYVK